MSLILGSLFAILFAILAVGVWIGFGLIATALVLAYCFSDIPVTRLMPQYAFNILTSSDLVALPLFVLMGEFLFRTQLSRSLFNGLAPWAGLLPGRLLHVNVIGCSIFAAISGSSAATTQVVGRMTLNELLRRGYSPDIATGSLAGAGTLGFLIPPSTVMIIYGVLAQESVLRLFTAGLHPGHPARRLLHGLDHDPHHDPPGAGAGIRARHAAHAVLRPRRRAEGTGAGAVPDPVRARLDVRRPRDADRGGGRRHRRRARRVGVAEVAELEGHARGGARRGADLLDDGPDHPRRDGARQHHRRARHSRLRRQGGLGLAAVAVHADHVPAGAVSRSSAPRSKVSR